jgi:hypothetical protein
VSPSWRKARPAVASSGWGPRTGGRGPSQPGIKNSCQAVTTCQLIGSGTLGPRALAIVGAAFDHAWKEIELHFEGPLARQAVRLMLANEILAIATDESRDVAELKWGAIHGLTRRQYLPRS